MRTRAFLLMRVALLIVMCGSTEAYASQEMLASAKSLYESASYEAALSELSAINSPELVDVVDTYRALCFLGLGRVSDAEQALALIVKRTPLLVLSDADYSPRIVALFRDVRKNALPGAAQRLYSSARTDYENKKYVAATDGFKQVLQVIADVDPEAQTGTLADIKELASGFLTLAEAKATPEASLRAPAAVSTAQPSSPNSTNSAAHRQRTSTSSCDTRQRQHRQRDSTGSDSTSRHETRSHTTSRDRRSSGSRSACRHGNAAPVLHSERFRRDSTGRGGPAASPLVIRDESSRARAQRDARARHRRERWCRERDARRAGLAAIRCGAAFPGEEMALRARAQTGQAGEVQACPGDQSRSADAAAALTTPRPWRDDVPRSHDRRRPVAPLTIRGRDLREITKRYCQEMRVT